MDTSLEPNDHQDLGFKGQEVFFMLSKKVRSLGLRSFVG